MVIALVIVIVVVVVVVVVVVSVMITIEAIAAVVAVLIIVKVVVVVVVAVLWYTQFGSRQQRLVFAWIPRVCYLSSPSMAKRQKLSDDKAGELLSLGRSSYASKAAIASLCSYIRDHGVPDASDRRAQFRARKHMCQTATPYGNMVVELPVAFVDGRSAKLGFQNPLAFFHYHCRESAHYAKIVSGALRRSPCSPTSPWTIIMYQDGVDPSDGLAKNHSRKSVVFYWSFAEFGMHALAHEEVWGTICVMRSSQVRALHGEVV